MLLSFVFYKKQQFGFNLNYIRKHQLNSKNDRKGLLFINYLYRLKKIYPY